MIMSSFFIDSAREAGFFPLHLVIQHTTHNEYRWISLKLITFKLPPERSISFVQKKNSPWVSDTGFGKRCPKVDNQWVIRNDDELLIRYDDSIYIYEIEPDPNSLGYRAT